MVRGTRSQARVRTCVPNHLGAHVLATSEKLGRAMNIRILVAAALGSCLMVAHASAQPADTSAEKMRLAQDVVAAQGGVEQAKSTLGAIFTQMHSFFDQNADPEVKKFEAVLLSKMQDEIVAMVPQILDVTVNVYASNLTENELESMLEWQRSDAGQSIAKKMPIIARESVQQMRPALLTYMQHMKADVIDQTCKEQKCSEKQREVITAMMEKAFPKQSS